MPSKITITLTKSFQGDTFRRVSLKDNEGREIPLFGVWLRRGHGERYYESDTSGRTFRTLKEVKAFAEEIYKEELKKELE